MARTRRRREIEAPRERVWEIVSDPHHLPRWWPGVERVEDATEQEWTEVHRSKRGRAVRADFTLLQAERPALLRWQQEVEATPFERFLAESVTELRLEAASGAERTRVELTVRQRLRGWARIGSWLFRGASTRRLDEALANLDSIAVR